MADIARYIGDTQFGTRHRHPNAMRPGQCRSAIFSLPFHQNRSHLGSGTRQQSAKNERRQRPAYLRLDSTGENSSGSSVGEDSTGFSVSPHANKGQCSDLTADRDISHHRSTTRKSEARWRLFDKVKEAAYPLSDAFCSRPRSIGRNLVCQDNNINSADRRLLDLDSVAKKFTNMSCNMGNQAHQSQSPLTWGLGSHGIQHGFQDKGARHYGTERIAPQYFHPYSGATHPKFILPTPSEHYRATYHHPWQQYAESRRPFFQPAHAGFDNFLQPFGCQVPAPPFPGHSWFTPDFMPGPSNRRQMNEAPRNGHHHLHRNRKQKTNRYRKQNRTQAQFASENSGHVKPTNDPNVCKSSETAVSNEGSTPTVHIADVSQSQVIPASLHNNCVNALTLANSEQKLDSDITDVPTVGNDHLRATSKSSDNRSADACNQRHSSINLILADYETRARAKPEENFSLDSDFSDTESGIATEEERTLWESFARSDDPYNPLRGWGSHLITNCSPSRMHNGDVDSGTDEGDDLSASDEDEVEDDGECQTGDNLLPENEMSTFVQSKPLKLATSMLQTLRNDPPSMPKKSNGSASPIHPSIAFVLGSALCSSDEDGCGDEDDDNVEWDALDDTAISQNDPLWNSFNKASDEYSPLEAWKCHASPLSSVELNRNPSNSCGADSPPARSGDSNCARIDENETVGCDDTDGASRNLDFPGDMSTSKDTSKEFEIPIFQVYSAPEDDCHLGTAKMGPFAIKRVASASCLKKAHVTPELKSIKQVRFCADSSFIVLVENEPEPREGEICPPVLADWEMCARDRMRFQERINQTALVLDPILASVHRDRVYEARLRVS